MSRAGPLARTWSKLRGDLSLFALLQIPFLLLTVLASRALAAFHAYPYSRPLVVSALLLRSLRLDLVAIAGLALALLVARRLRCPERARGGALAAIYLAFFALSALYLAAAAVFVRFGAPITRDLLALGGPLLGHSLKVVSSDDPLVRLMAASLALPALLALALWRSGTRLVRDERRFSGRAWAGALAIALSALASGLLPANPHRERRLRDVSPLALALPAAWATPPRPPPPSPAGSKVIAALLGGKQAEGAAAFATFTRRRRNVVFWVMESVGERFLRSHHRLGTARTPELDRLEAAGSVRFSDVHVECPLSIQSNYTLVTGESPPGNPHVYRTSTGLGRRAPYLPALLKAAGYHTAYLNSSYLQMWGERRFLGEAGLDVVEDAETLANRSRYRYQPWSIEGRALVDRFFEWRDALPTGEPFFAMIWSVEGHFHYYWIGMPASLEALGDEERYDRLLEHNDALLGRFYDGLAARGLAANTLLVAVGDHGQGLGRGQRAYDRFESLLVSEDDIQIPLSFIDPELPRAVVTTPASLADVYPTVLDLLGMEVPAGADGASLAREYQPRALISRAITWWPLAVRAGAFKLEQDFADEPPVLYDVARDPWELRDVAGEHPEVTDALWAEAARETARRQRDDPSFGLFSFSDRRGR